MVINNKINTPIKTGAIGKKRNVLFNKIRGKRFTWGWGNQEYSVKFKLDKSGKITGYVHQNETNWSINPAGNLVITNASGKIQWEFIKVRKWRGSKLYFETSDKHYLKQK